MSETPTAGDKADLWLLDRIPTPTYRPPIFLSYPTPVSQAQSELVKAIYRLLSRRTLTPRTLGVNEYDFEAPLRAIRRLMNQSQGLFAIAFRKTAVQSGSTIWRRGHRQGARALEQVYLTSPWIQIEAAMAFQLGLPVLLVREKDVVSDGLLEPGVIVYSMPEFDPDEPPSQFLRSDEFVAALDSWVARVRESALGWHVLRDQGGPHE